MKLDEIARLAGVSRTTASYVINGKAKKYRISDKTIANVLEIVKKYQFQPNAVAAGLRAGKTFSIGVVIPDLENLSYAKIANYLEQFSREKGYQLLISCSKDKPELEMQSIFHLHRQRVNAIIVSSSFTKSHEFYENWQNKKLPIFALDRSINEKHFCTIAGSDRDDAKMLTTEFRLFAGKKVIFVGALQNLSVSRLREDGFKEAWKSDPRIVTFLYAKNYVRTDSEKIFTNWLTKNPLPNAIFTTSFALLQGVIDAILKLNGFLPNDLVIATFGDNELLDFLPCAVISLSQQHKKIAKKTVDLIFEYLSENQYKAGLTIVKRKLIHRGGLNR